MKKDKKPKVGTVPENKVGSLLRMPITELTPNEANPRKITAARKAQLRKSLESLGNLSPITWNRTTGRVIGGNQRLEGYRDLGHTEVDVWVVELDEAREKAAVVALNNHAGEWDNDKLAAILKEIRENGDAELSGFSDSDLQVILDQVRQQDQGGDRETLSERFGVPPFSVLDARQGYWQNRKAAWLSLGIQSELGRGGNALDMNASQAGITGEKEKEEWNKARGSSPKSKIRRKKNVDAS